MFVPFSPAGAPFSQVPGVFSDAPLLHPSMLANSDRIGEQVVCRLKWSRLVRL